MNGRAEQSLAKSIDSVLVCVILDRFVQQVEVHCQMFSRIEVRLREC